MRRLRYFRCYIFSFIASWQVQNLTSVLVLEDDSAPIDGIDFVTTVKDMVKTLKGNFTTGEKMSANLVISQSMDE